MTNYQNSSALSPTRDNKGTEYTIFDTEHGDYICYYGYNESFYIHLYRTWCENYEAGEIDLTPFGGVIMDNTGLNNSNGYILKLSMISDWGTGIC